MNNQYKRDSLYNSIWAILEEDLGDTPRTSEVTELLCDIVSDWCPKKGDFWLNKGDQYIYVNRGWEIVGLEALE
jgi:hypothetical protein